MLGAHIANRDYGSFHAPRNSDIASNEWMDAELLCTDIFVTAFKFSFTLLSAISSYQGGTEIKNIKVLEERPSSEPIGNTLTTCFFSGVVLICTIYHFHVSRQIFNDALCRSHFWYKKVYRQDEILENLSVKKGERHPTYCGKLLRKINIWPGLEAGKALAQNTAAKKETMKMRIFLANICFWASVSSLFMFINSCKYWGTQQELNPGKPSFSYSYWAVGSCAAFLAAECGLQALKKSLTITIMRPFFPATELESQKQHGVSHPERKAESKSALKASIEPIQNSTV